MQMHECEYCKNADMKIKPGYAYVPPQKLSKVYSPEAALTAGTVFPELDITLEEYERGIYCGR